MGRHRVTVIDQESALFGSVRFGLTFFIGPCHHMFHVSDRWRASFRIERFPAEERAILFDVRSNLETFNEPSGGHACYSMHDNQLVLGYLHCHLTIQCYVGVIQSIFTTPRDWENGKKRTVLASLMLSIFNRNEG